jgi:hypothetical protein
MIGIYVSPVLQDTSTILDLWMRCSVLPVSRMLTLTKEGVPAAMTTTVLALISFVQHIRVLVTICAIQTPHAQMNLDMAVKNVGPMPSATKMELAYAWKGTQNLHQVC